jgi:hypothetical protein
MVVSENGVVNMVLRRYVEHPDRVYLSSGSVKKQPLVVRHGTRASEEIVVQASCLRILVYKHGPDWLRFEHGSSPKFGS